MAMPPILIGGRSVNGGSVFGWSPATIRVSALDHDLHRERRQDHHEHGGVAVPQRAHHQPLDHDAERGDRHDGDRAASEQRQPERVEARCG